MRIRSAPCKAIHRWIRCFLAPIACLGLASSAVILPGFAVPLNKSVQIGLRGQISAKCSLSHIGSMPLLRIAGNPSQAQSAALDFIVNCNAPFVYGLSSENGALVFRSAGDKARNPTNHLPYRIELTLPTNDGGAISSTCDSADLAKAGLAAGACTADSGQAIATAQKGRIVLRWQPGQTLLSGDYSDGLNIQINAKN